MKLFKLFISSALISALLSACILGDKPDIPSASAGGDGDSIDLGGENSGNGGAGGCSGQTGQGGGAAGESPVEETACAD